MAYPLLFDSTTMSLLFSVDRNFVDGRLEGIQKLEGINDLQSLNAWLVRNVRRTVLHVLQDQIDCWVEVRERTNLPGFNVSVSKLTDRDQGVGLDSVCLVDIQELHGQNGLAIFLSLTGSIEVFYTRAGHVGQRPFWKEYP